MNQKHYLDEQMPCKHEGHQPTYRYVSSSKCVACSHEMNAKMPKDERLAANRKYKAKMKVLYPSATAMHINTLKACREALTGYDVDNTALLALIDKAIAFKRGDRV